MKNNKGKVIPFDYHIHTNRCGHAIGSIEEYVIRAIEMGLREIAFTDHHPLFDVLRPELTMSIKELPKYIEEVISVNEMYPEIDVLLGIEVDYIPGKEREIDLCLALYPYDIILGSVHFLDGWAFDSPYETNRYDGLDLKAFWSSYYGTLSDAVRTGLFDVVAHPDLAKKFGYRIDWESEKEMVHGLLSEMKRKDMALEVNTAGLRWPSGEIYPSGRVLEMANSMGISITIGSDAHCPEDICRDFSTAASAIESAGYREIARFRQRKRFAYTFGENDDE